MNALRAWRIVAPAIGELAKAHLGSGVLEGLAGQVGEQSADAAADGALSVEDDLADLEVGAARGEDAVDDVFEERFEERLRRG